MEWIDISLEQPKQAGKYLVKTRTMMGNTHKVEAIFSITKDEKTGKEKKHFNVSNQVVTHWLNEEDLFIKLDKLPNSFNKFI
jgi:hypothetical protein